MPKPLAIYTDLTPDVQATLNDVADRIRDRLQLTIKNIIEIGHDLNAVKKELGHGRFTPWIETEFGMSDQTARNFMNVATRFPKSKSLLDLKITKEALYLLAAPSTDGEVVEVVMEKAGAGEKVGKAEVDQIKQQLENEKDKNADLRLSEKALIGQHERLHNIDLAQRNRILALEHELENTQKKPAQSELRTYAERVAEIEELKAVWSLCSEETRKQFVDWVWAGEREPLPEENP